MGFSAEWLALREPADRVARDPALARRACKAAGAEPLILDLGCGTGATWRALTPLLPAGARWYLVDSDPMLLAAAAAAAGDSAETIEADIGDLSSLPLDGVTLVTASALLDLVPDTWLQELARRLTVPFYAALNYSGVMRWSPADPRDGTISAYFNRDQRRDKGLGPALGPEAGGQAARILTAAGFASHLADSPWHLGPESAGLQRELTDGIAAAAAQAGAAGAIAWGKDRRDLAASSTCMIGHSDILALPRHGAAGSTDDAR